MVMIRDIRKHGFDGCDLLTFCSGRLAHQTGFHENPDELKYPCLDLQLRDDIIRKNLFAGDQSFFALRKNMTDLLITAAEGRKKGAGLIEKTGKCQLILRQWK